MFNALVQAFSNFLSPDDAVSPLHEDYPPSEEGVDIVREILLDFLPLELVDVILDTAMYWPCVYASQGLGIIVRHSQACCYLITPPIPAQFEQSSNSTQRHRTVREIRFRINSHDQGWGGAPEHNGTYEGSWTWFETIILNPSSSSLHHRLVGSDLSKPFILRDDDLTMINAEQDGTPLQSRRWHVQTNVTASRAWKEHTIIWTEEEKPASEQHYDVFKGRVGRGHEVVRALKPGDRLAVIAKAEFPAWENHVSDVSVEISYFFY